MSKLHENSLFRGNDKRINLGTIDVKIPEQFTEPYDSSLGIKRYGSDNLYPQNVRKLVLGSPTGNVCRIRYSDFIEGDGIENGSEIRVNRMQMLNDLIHDIAQDYSMYGGFAIHVTYNGMGQVTDLRCMPFETLRLAEEDSAGYFSKIKYCADWSGYERTQNGKNINPLIDTVDYYPYDDDIQVTLNRIEQAGGAENYKGEILYVSNRLGYPIGRADSILSVLSTEEGLMNIGYRNARNGFMPSAVLCLPSNAKEKLDQFKNNLKRLQGDQNAMKILTFEVASKDDKPEVVDLHIQNYDKEFTITSDATVQRIYASYKQDAFYLLYMGKIGFGGEVLASMFNLYNISVRGERGVVERTLKRLSKKFQVLNAIDLSIVPLVYKINDTENTNLENL